MKLAILQNSDVMEKNGFRIRTQRPKIKLKQVVLFQDKKKVILLTCEIGQILTKLFNIKNPKTNEKHPV